MKTCAYKSNTTTLKMSTKDPGFIKVILSVVTSIYLKIK